MRLPPQWIQYFNEAELAAEFRHCLRDLGRAAKLISAGWFVTAPFTEYIESFPGTRFIVGISAHERRRKSVPVGKLWRSFSPENLAGAIGR